MIALLRSDFVSSRAYHGQRTTIHLVREGNVFTGVCHSVRGGISGPVSLRGEGISLVPGAFQGGIPGTKPLFGGWVYLVPGSFQEEEGVCPGVGTDTSDLRSDISETDCLRQRTFISLIQFYKHDNEMLLHLSFV